MSIDLPAYSAASITEFVRSSAQFVNPARFGELGVNQADIEGLVRAVLSDPVFPEGYKASLQYEKWDEYFHLLQTHCAAKGFDSFETFIILLAAARDSEAVCLNDATLKCLPRELLRKLPASRDSFLDAFVRRLRRCLSPAIAAKAELPVIGSSNVINPAALLPSDASLPGTDKSGLLENICFVDRTNFIQYVLEKRAVLFLRPRRFGKSIWIKILRRFFESPRSFTSDYCVSSMRFEITPGLWWDPQEKGGFEGCSVLTFDFSRFDRTSADSLKLALKHQCQRMAELHGVKVLADDTWDSLLSCIITQLSNNLTTKSVVVLVDEYDYCLSSSLLAVQSKEFLALKEVHSQFYSTLKSLCDGLLLRFVTGISRWTLAGFGSGPNDIRDRTLDPHLSQLLGFTLDEVITIAQAHWSTRPDMLKVFREQCNDYCFDTTDLSRKVFNPFFVACEVDKILPNSRQQHWAATAPSMAVKYYKLIENLKLPIKLSEYEIANADPLDAKCPAAILFYMGYLTLKEPPAADDEGKKFTLGYPNDSIGEYLTKEFLARVIRGLRDEKKILGEDDMAKCLDQRPVDLYKFFTLLDSIFISMPFIFFNPTKGGVEADLERNLFLYFRGRSDGTGGELDVDAEQAIHFGRSDLELWTKTTKLIIELKLTESHDPSEHRKLAEQGLRQAKLKRYGSSGPPRKGEPLRTLYYAGAAAIRGQAVLQAIVLESGACFMLEQGLKTGASSVSQETMSQTYVSDSISGAGVVSEGAQTECQAPSALEENLATSCVRLRKEPSRNEFYISSIIQYLEYHEKEQEKSLKGQPEDARVVNKFTALVKSAKDSLDKEKRIKEGINALSLLTMTDEEMSVVFGTAVVDIPTMRSAIDFSKPTFASLIENRSFAELPTPTENDALALVKDIVTTFIPDLTQRNVVLAALGTVGKPKSRQYRTVDNAQKKLGVQLAIRGAKQVLTSAKLCAASKRPQTRPEVTEPEAKRQRRQQTK